MRPEPKIDRGHHHAAGGQRFNARDLTEGDLWQIRALVPRGQVEQ
jgi:hypothetical protein